MQSNIKKPCIHNFLLIFEFEEEERDKDDSVKHLTWSFTSMIELQPPSSKTFILCSQGT